MRVRKQLDLLHITILLTLIALLMSAFCLGQITTSTIVGTVTDNSGAAVAGAQVTAVNVATSYSRSVRTNDQGEYRLEFLPIGDYRVEVTSSGFEKLVRSGIVVQIAQPTRVDAQLQVGQVSQTVEVVSQAPLVNTTTPEIGRTVDTKEIENLPIVNRNVYTLLSLTPGVQSNANSIVLGYPEQRTIINGGVDVGAGSVNYYLDGGSNMTGIRNTGNILPDPDAIEEFRVQTNSYNAQYGRFQNGIVNVLTKSGTNQIHASAFEFVRNTIFNANNWGSTLATPPFHRNQFGGTVGGPIIKDKTFFFASYGGLRQITSTFESSAVIPGAAEFPTSAGANFGSATGGVAPNDPKTGKPFPNNIIPFNRIDPTALNIVKQFIPTAPNSGNQFDANVPNPYDTDEFLGKVDHNFTDNQRLSLSYFETSGNNNIVPSGSNLPYGLQQFNWRQHNANVSDTWTLSPTLINQAWLSYTRNFGGRLNTPAESLASFGSAFTPDGPVSLPDISVTGFFHLADAIDGPVTGTNFYSLRDVVSWNHGRHSVSFGAEESLEKDIQEALLNNYGVYAFSGASTTPSGKKCPDCAWADFLLGIPSKVQQDAPSFGYTNSWYTAFFVQDDFRFKPRLTFNLGFRWDIQTPPTDPQNKESTFIPGVQSTVRPTAPVGILFPGDPGITRGIVPVHYNHLSPRLGFAFDPFGDGKTSIRAAAGLFWGSVSGNEWNTTSNFEPFAIRINPFPNINKNGTAATLSNPYQGYPGGDPFPYAGGFVNGATIFGPSPNFQWPYTYQLSASIQRQITNNLSLQVAYVGSLNHDEPFGVDLNYPLAGNAAVPASKAAASNAAARRPDQSFGIIYSLQSNQTASYNGLQISAVQRLSHHLSFNAWYVYAHSFDSAQLDANTAQQPPEDFNNPQFDRGNSDFDIRHQMTVSMIYQPDYYTGDNRFLKNVVNGWSIAPIFTARTGLPFSVGNSIDANFDGNTNDRAEIVGNPYSGTCPNGFAVGTIQCWFNTAAFAQNNPAAGNPIDGNSGRNAFRAPSYKNMDLAIFRTFNMTERFHLEFRAEASNTFNFANYNTPNATVAASNFGTITGANTMRQLQLGLRLTY